MKCDIKIMASPKRREYVTEMCERNGLDVGKDVFFDDRPKGGFPYYTFKKTIMLPAEEGVTHRCILQDDVLTCNNFRDVIEEIAKTMSNAVLSLFCPRSVLQEMRIKNPDARYVYVKKCGVYGQANIAPLNVFRAACIWGENNSSGHDVKHDDVLLGEYALNRGIPVYYTLPMLVQHMCPTESLLGFNNKRKVSKVFDIDAYRYDWTDTRKILSITMPNSTTFY